jgi:hypothetical protein
VAECAPQVFTGVVPEQFAKLTAKAKAAGIDLNGNNGSATKFGVKVAWTYSPDSLQLVLQCLHKPFFVSGDDVNAKLQDLVKQSLSEA